jgi:transcription-repair coupling factor (superfamily II helicase)
MEVGHLSRFAKAAEAKAVKGGLADGSLRIVVGTHALAAKGISFKNLGLLVVDEEQRFGSRHKAGLRSLGDGVHVLTLTATPIPRTLRLATIGLRSLSVIATPPARRLPIRTITSDFEPSVLSAALRYERHRAGQSFVVCPRIEDIAPMQDRLKEITPELDLLTVHGRMPAATIDETIMRFAEGRGDVLLTTNIIESGLDLPRANTILIWRPERFGMAQLHQLRGRVGRGNRRGFAYLITHPELKKGRAAKRLRAIQDHSGLGSGFAISERDMDTRGAGDPFGETQAGHLKLVGADLYGHLLRRAFERARGEEPAADYLPELSVEITGIIPREYVGDEQLRLELYARAAKSSTEGELDDFEEEIEDRFGTIPTSVRNLVALARIRVMCRRLGISRIDAGAHAIAITFLGPHLQAIQQTLKAENSMCWREGRLVCAESSARNERIATVTALLERLGEV